MSSENLVWSVDIGKQEPRKKFIVLGVMCLVGLAGLVFPGGNIAFSIIGMGLILASNPEVFLPIRYELTESSAKSRCFLSFTVVEWSQVKKMWEDEDGIKLSIFEKRSRLEAFRGVYLRYANNRDAVLAKISEHTHGDAAILERGIDGGGSNEPLSESRDPHHEEKIGGSSDTNA